MQRYRRIKKILFVTAIVTLTMILLLFVAAFIGRWVDCAGCRSEPVSYIANEQYEVFALKVSCGLKRPAINVRYVYSDGILGFDHSLIARRNVDSVSLAFVAPDSVHVRLFHIYPDADTAVTLGLSRTIF